MRQIVEVRERARELLRMTAAPAGGEQNPPAWARAVVERHYEEIITDASLGRMLVTESMTTLARTMLKLGDDDARQGQLTFADYPIAVRPILRAVGRQAVHVPSRNAIVPITATEMSTAEMREAGEYLVEQGEDCIRRGRHLIRAASLLDVA
jgi:hypothetical protein